MADLGDLKNILMKKYQDNNLASVYLAKYPDQTNPINWAKDFMLGITPLEDHPDVLWMERAENDNEYKVESPAILALLKFLNYRPFELKKKFIFVNDAHLMSVIVSNKLLKIFEELPENFCLFLFAPQSQNLLPTVESRAIKILMPADFNQTSDENKDIQFNSAMDLVSHLKKSEDDFSEEKNFIENALNKTLTSKNFNECSESLEKLKHYGVSENFNNTKVSRLSMFFS